MATPAEIRQKLERVFDERQASVLAEVFADAHGELIRTADFEGLTATVKELAQAQTRTEQRVGDLVQVQLRTEQRIGELAQAQARTEAALQKLTLEHGETRRQLGGISMTIGYTLENEAFKALPVLLQRDFGMSLRGRLKRQYVTDKDGKSIEVNIIGKATKEEREVVIVGEAESQLSKNDGTSSGRNNCSSLWMEVHTFGS